MDIISSTENAQIKELKSLSEKKFRKFYGQFVLEGPKSVKEALFAGTKITKLFVAESKQNEYQNLIGLFGKEPLIVADKLFGKLTDIVSPQGIIAQAEMRVSGDFKPNAPFLVLDRISDPGNLGTIIRSAVATGIKDIVLIDTADPYSPKTVRSSASGINFVNFYPLDEEMFVSICKKLNFNILVADMAGENIYKSPIDLNQKFCIVIGNEANGPSALIKSCATKIISLPMKKEMESLNAGVCTSVMLYTIFGKNI